MPTPIIRVAHLTKRFGAQVVVDDLSFEVAPGETLVLLGPSGCGKTTLLKTLNRLVEPDGGTIEINGRDVRQQRPEELRRGLGYVIQQVGLLPHLTVAQNVGVVPGLLGYPAAETAARTTELLNRLHLPAERFGPMLPAQLSGGQQQRVGLARALAADPPVVLLDEPFGALDPLTRAAVRRDFRELDELRRKTVVLVTHDVQEAFELADRIMLLNNGRIQQLGPPRELLLHPANDFVRSFFQAEQLALQLRVLTLADLAPYLPPPTAQPRQPVPPATSLGQVLSWLTSAPRPAAETGAAPQLADAATLAQGSPSPAEASTTQAGAPTTQVEASTGLAKASTTPAEAPTTLAEASTIPFKVSTTPAEVSAREAEAPAGGAHGLTRRVEASAALAAAAAGPADASAFPGAPAGAGPWGLAGPGATWQPLTLPLVLAALGELLASLSPAAPHADA